MSNESISSESSTTLNINSEEIERLRYTHDLIIDWIKTADSKAQAAVGLAAAIVSVLALIKSDSASANSGLFTVASFICIGLSVISWIFSGLAFFPKVKPISPRTVLFFGDIASQIPLRSLNAGLEYIGKIKKQDFGEDLSFQIVMNAHICRQKYLWVSRSIITVFASMFFFFVAIILRVWNYSIFHMT